MGFFKKSRLRYLKSRRRAFNVFDTAITAYDQADRWFATVVVTKHFLLRFYDDFTTILL